MRLEGKVALITGGSKGLGEADVRQFVAEGARAIIGDVDTEAGEALAGELGGSARFVHLDVRSEQAFKATIDGIMRDYGRLDVLVNNAGVVEPGTPETVEEADYRFVMAVSVDGTVFGCKHAIPAMRETGGGAIINMSSVASIQGIPYSAAYSAAKGAIEAYTRSVSVHCTTRSIPVRCNSVHPGAFSTPMMASMPAKMAKVADHDADVRYERRANLSIGQPVEVAKLVTFLASDDSRHITGQRFVIDNGGVVTPLGVG